MSQLFASGGQSVGSNTLLQTLWYMRSETYEDNSTKAGREEGKNPAARLT